MSPTGYSRFGGAWVQSGLTGKARFGGADVAYAPPGGGTVDEVFTFPTPPTLPNLDDGSRVNLGVLWSASQAGSWIPKFLIYLPTNAK